MGIKRPSFNGTQLKLFFGFLMFLSHLQYLFFDIFPEWMGTIGNAAAAGFLFFVCEGFAHTRDRKRYYLRVWGGSVLMAIIYHFAAYHYFAVRPDWFFPQNGILQNYLVCFVLWEGIDLLKARRPWVGEAFLLFPALWSALLTLAAGRWPRAMDMVHCVLFPNVLWIADGGLMYILCGVVLYLLRSRRTLQLSIGAIAFVFFFTIGYWAYCKARGSSISLETVFNSKQWLLCLACAPLLLYNGKRGKGCARLFYTFYPAHIYALYAVSCIVYAYRYSDASAIDHAAIPMGVITVGIVLVGMIIKRGSVK